VYQVGVLQCSPPPQFSSEHTPGSGRRAVGVVTSAVSLLFPFSLTTTHYCLLVNFSAVQQLTAPPATRRPHIREAVSKWSEWLKWTDLNRPPKSPGVTIPASQLGYAWL